MFIRVSGSNFKVALSKLVQSSKATQINLCLKEDYLYIQSTGTIINELKIDVVDFEKESGFSRITLTVDQTYQLINPNQELMISISESIGKTTNGLFEEKKGLVEFKQDDFRYSAVAEPVERYNIDTMISMTDVFSIHNFVDLVQNTRNLDAIGKILAVGVSSINIKDNKAYIGYSNTVYIDNIKLPDCAISSDVARKFIPVASKYSSTYYTMDITKGIMTCRLSDRENAVISVQRVNSQIVKGVMCIEETLTIIASLSLSKYSNCLSVIYRAYPKAKVELSICKNGIGIFVHNGLSNFNIGEFENVINIITISTAQLNALNKLFGDCTVDVLKGKNCLCFQPKNSEKKLILSGMIL